MTGLELSQLYSWRWRWSHYRSPYSIVIRALLLAMAALTLTLITPGYLAYRWGVFYNEQLRMAVPTLVDVAPEVRAAFVRYNQLQDARKARIAVLDERLVQTDPRDAAPLIALRNTLATQAADSKPPYSFIAFYLSQQTLLWPAIYTCLLWTIVFFPPAKDATSGRVLRSASTWLLAVCLHAFYQWPLWTRNFVLRNEEGRTIYAYPNWDVNWKSFWVQEVVVFGFFVLLATLWQQWLAHFNDVRQSIRRETDAEYHGLLDDHRGRALAEAFRHWIYCSVIVSIGFFAFTAFFWDLIGKLHDRRYLISAILIHTLWGMTWIVISLPMLTRANDWSERRMRVLRDLIGRGGIDSVRADLEVIKQLEPISMFTIVVANITSITSFVLPVVQAFIK